MDFSPVDTYILYIALTVIFMVGVSFTEQFRFVHFFIDSATC